MKKIVFTLIVFAFLANVSAQIKVNSSGNVGIGTANPQYKLDVTGNTRITGDIYLGGSSGVFGTEGSVPITFKVNGTLAGNTGASGQANVSFGYGSFASNTTGNYNTANGYNALNYNATGNYNTANGYNALYSNTVGGGNTAIGSLALYSNAMGNGNTANGYNALKSNATGNYNTANGYNALYSNTTGYGNTANGSHALYSNTTGYRNTANGYYALNSNTISDYNTAIGFYALNSNTMGSGNTAIGSNALYSNTTGLNNTAIGHMANFNTTGLNNTVALGYEATITSGNQARIGNSNVTSIGGYAGWTNFSDKRAKKNIRTNVPGLAFINQLQPVTFNLDLDAIDGLLKIDRTKINEERELSRELTDLENKAREAKEKIVQTGFIAQDVEETAKSVGYDFSGVDVDEAGIYGLRYAEFVVPLVKAVQELSEQNDRLQAQINELTGPVYGMQGKEYDLSLLRSQSNASTTGLSEVSGSGASLYQNSPNPFTEQTEIRYFLPSNIRQAYICIFDMQGKMLQKLNVTAGQNSIIINGSTLQAGMYLYSLIADGKEVDTKRMILTK